MIFFNFNCLIYTKPICYLLYFLNSNLKLEHEAGILFEDDFESPTSISDNWLKKEAYPDISTIIEHNADLNSNVAKFTKGRKGGDMFTNSVF